MSWRPNASKSVLMQRAQNYERIRHFFTRQNVMEVETPILGLTCLPRLQWRSLHVGERLLQASPGLLMLRLIASGSGDIYQIAKVFKPSEQQGPASGLKEWSAVEWYRQGFDTWAIMEEMADILDPLLACPHFDYVSYKQIFDEYLGLNPCQASEQELRFEAAQHLNIEIPRADKEDWLQLLFNCLVEPHLGKHAPVFVYDFPKYPAELAKLGVDEQGDEIVEFFRLYYRGKLLGQGYLPINTTEQLSVRLELDNQWRKNKGLKPMALDGDLLQAVASGQPDCAAAMINVDILLMLQLGIDHVGQVVSFEYPS